MSSVKLDTIIDEFPEEREAVGRLMDFINSNAQVDGAARMFSIGRIFDVIHPSSQRVLVKMLMRAVEYGYVEKVLRVDSDLGGIGEYKSLSDIPDVLHDRKGREVEVRPDQISLLYKIRTSTNFG